MARGNFADDGEQVLAIYLFHDAKHAIPTGISINRVVAVCGVEQNFDAWQAMRD
jgi:hypothetical protein